MLLVPSSSTHATERLPAECWSAAAAAAATSYVHTRDFGKQLGCAFLELAEVSRGGSSASKPATLTMRATAVAQMPTRPVQCTRLHRTTLNVDRALPCHTAQCKEHGLLYCLDCHDGKLLHLSCSSLTQEYCVRAWQQCLQLMCVTDRHDAVLAR